MTSFTFNWHLNTIGYFPPTGLGFIFLNGLRTSSHVDSGHYTPLRDYRLIGINHGSDNIIAAKTYYIF